MPNVRVQQCVSMFVFYHLFHRCVHHAPSTPPVPSSTPPEPSVPSPDPEKDCAVLVWFTVFGFSLLFRPAAEFALRFLFFSACTFLISALDGALNLLVGHAVLRAATSDNGYDPPLSSSLEAGSLGGILVIGPITLSTICLMALLGVPKRPRVLSVPITLLLELVSVIAVAAAACTLGVAVLRGARPLGDGAAVAPSVLDRTHAARAGVLGACVLTLPIVSAAAFLMRDAYTVSSSSAPLGPDDNFVVGGPTHAVASSPRTRAYRHVVAHTAAETVGYVLVTLCILSLRLLCF